MYNTEHFLVEFKLKKKTILIEKLIDVELSYPYNVNY